MSKQRQSTITHGRSEVIPSLWWVDKFKEHYSQSLWSLEAHALMRWLH